jgi:subtilisin-like proprotein convertase family protein
MGDIDINLKAPNGYVLNLFNVHGGSGDNLVNTVISSQGTKAFSTGVAPFTDTFRATGSLNRGPTGYLSNVQSFAQLYSVPSGTWTLALVDSVPVDVGPLTRWDITFDICNSTNSNAATTGPPTNLPTFKPTAFPAASVIVHKVRVQLEGTNAVALNMREVEVLDTSGVNRALNKYATQSSTYLWNNITPKPASLAVNGNLNDLSHTQNEAGNVP